MKTYYYPIASPQNILLPNEELEGAFVHLPSAAAALVGGGGHALGAEERGAVITGKSHVRPLAREAIQATSVCGLQLIAYAALSYVRPLARQAIQANFKATPVEL